ncbi:MAG: TetR/AcrR family transcriptional regulator [Acidimicrobiales bacterium]|nr:TetR/AcrR family transcriptional regulator [Acidimicrobiales bacterium]
MARRRTYLPAERVKADLVDATLRLMATRRPSQVTVREIAAEAGHDHALVFRHFGDKATLVRTASFALLLDWAESVREADDAVDGFVAGFDYLATQPSLAGAISTLFTGDEPVEPGTDYPVADAHVAQLVAAGMGEGPARTFTVGMIAMYSAFAAAERFWVGVGRFDDVASGRAAMRELVRHTVAREIAGASS